MLFSVLHFIVCFFSLCSPQASGQMKDQVQKSSSIIVALTDGKLSPYILELTIKEVSTGQTGRIGCISVFPPLLLQKQTINNPFCFSRCCRLKRQGCTVRGYTVSASRTLMKVR